MRGVRPHGDLLELGSGNGAIAHGMAESCPDVSITASDVDPAMVAAAERLLAGRPNVTVETADVTELPFPDESFDFVASFLMLHHVVEWHTAIAEVARVLRPGGTFFGYDLSATRLAEVVHWADRSPHRLIAVDELAPALADAGLEIVEVRPRFAGHVVQFRARASL